MKIRSVDRPEKIPSSRTRVQNRRCLQLDLVSLISLSHSLTHSLTRSYFYFSHLTIYLTLVPYYLTSLFISLPYLIYLERETIYK